MGIGDFLKNIADSVGGSLSVVNDSTSLYLVKSHIKKANRISLLLETLPYQERIEFLKRMKESNADLVTFMVELERYGRSPSLTNNMQRRIR